MKARYLADKSAWVWADAVPRRWRELVSAGEVATCSMVDLEVLFSSRSSADWKRIRDLRAGLERISVDQGIFDRAQEVQGLLSEQTELGHRSVDLPDLVVAACAEGASLAVLHYDHDFERIAAVTGQPCEWLAKQGSLRR